MEEAKVRTLYDNDTGEAIAPRTSAGAVSGLQEKIDEAVAGVTLPDNLIVGEDEELPPAELALNADTFGGFGPEHYATEESVEKKADQSALTDGLADKQDKITGTSGQIVGFDEAGNAVAQDAPRSSSAYVHRFESGDWTQASEQDEYTITVNSDTHKMAGSIVSCIAMVKDANSYLQTAFGAVQTYATIDDGNVITIHAKDAYTGLAILTAYE